MRARVIVLVGIVAASMVGTTLYLDSLLRGMSTVQIADILSRPPRFHNSVVQLHGWLEPYSPEPWASYPSRYGLLRDETGAIALSFPDEAPARYFYGELNVTGRVQYNPRAYKPGLWLYVEVSSYQGSEVTLGVELRKTGGVAGLNDSVVIEPSGAGKYSRGFGPDKLFELTNSQLFQLKALIVGNDFQAVKPETFGAKPDVADYFTYSLTVAYYAERREVAKKKVSWVDEWALKEPLPENLEHIRRGLEALVAEILKAASIDESEAMRLAVSALRGSVTFMFDGLEEGLKVTGVTKVVSEPPMGGYFWLVEVSFLTAHPGHGNRSGLVLLQLVTTHRALVTVDKAGEVTGAICDGVWDLLADREIASPPSKPTRFTAVVNEARKLDVYVDADLTDGVTQDEARLIAEATFNAVMGEKALRRLDTITREGGLVKAHFSWGYSLEDLGHVFDMTADLATRSIIVTHCR